jgi:hypothetical protein
MSSLIFETFLAAPLDTSELYTERKFSGRTTDGRHGSINVVMGSAIDAYAHHVVLVDSGGGLLLTDLQGESSQCSMEQEPDLRSIVRCCWTRPVC